MDSPSGTDFQTRSPDLNQGPVLPPTGAGRFTRRRSSAGPIDPNRPKRQLSSAHGGSGSGPKPTYLTLRDHGKIFVADLPRLSDGQLAHVAKEAREVLESLSRRLLELEGQVCRTQADRDIRIRASTKRDVTDRFIRSIEAELEQRRNNPVLRSAAGESLARAFLQLARHRLPGATFDSLLQEALAACGESKAAGTEIRSTSSVASELSDSSFDPSSDRSEPMPVVLTPDCLPEAV
ncbi:MAG: hypothetical protein VKK98_01600 [Cyanobacteriota bacterium]|nr:hypothetical protein [Cyanobacteriota bacterium]